MKIVLASRNKKKKAELEALLSRYIDDIEILSLDDVGMFDEIEENGSTFAENALIKAHVAAKSGLIGIGDDSGLVVDALGGAPGIYSARYGGDHGNDALNNKKLLDDMNGIIDRRASFVCTIACVLPNMNDPIVSEGYIHGEILREQKGKGGFGYDPLFYVPTHGKTMAELTPEEKNMISHRANALRIFAEEFKKRLGK